jgi:alpha-glucosidase
MKRIFLLLIVLCFVNAAYTKEYKLTSPDGKIVVTINTEPDIKWSASCHGHEIINSAIAGIILENNKILGQNEILRKAVMGKVDQILVPVVANKNSRISDNCNTLLLTFKSGFSINFRAYNDGVAYRFETSLKDTITIKNEITDIQFPEGSYAWFPYEAGFMSHNENVFTYSALDTIQKKHMASLPTLFKANNINVLIPECGFAEEDLVKSQEPGPLILLKRCLKAIGTCL